jgi:glucose-6-phosphate isomerase
MKNYLHFDEVVSKDFVQEAYRESTYVGFYNLPDQNIDNIINFANKQDIDIVAVIGIGGSSLGAEAIYNFLNSKNHYIRKLIFFDTTDPIAIENKIHLIQNNRTMFLVISKSGTTVESISILKYIDTKFKLNKDNLVVITDKNSPLEKFAETRNLKIFYIPDNVGGRYSVLTAVGLLPLALVGVNINELIYGAKILKDSFFSTKNSQIIIKKASYYAKHSDIFTSNALFSYSESLRSFNSWYVQLWGESLGKREISSAKKVGLTPIGLIGPTDQHSFLQLIMEGKTDKTLTVIKIKDFENNLTIPENNFENLESLNILNNIKFADLINMQADSIIEAIQSIEIPLDVIELDNISEKSIGELIYYYELLTALVAMQLDINAYDQPGVELGKKILKNKMSKR